MGVILNIVSDFYDLIILKLALFILTTYCTLWIIGMACFSGLESWKTNLFSHYLINFSFTFLFIVTSIITIVTLLLLFSLMLPVFFLICHVLFVLSFILTIVVVVASMSFICGCVTMVCGALLRFIMAMYMFVCMCVCVYNYEYVCL